MNPASCEGIKTISAGYENAGVWQAAHAYCLSRFAEDFRRRHGGVALIVSEREYTTFGHRNPAINQVLRALEKHFRTFKGRWDNHKPDGMGISADGFVGEILEVTTESQYAKKPRTPSHAAEQLKRKLYTLERTVNFINPIRTQWLATPWRPGVEETCMLPSANGARWICYKPTHRVPDLDRGIVLYEAHEMDSSPLPAPAAIPNRIRRMIEEMVRANPLDSAKTHPVEWAAGLLAKFALVAALLVTLLAILKLAGLIAALASLSGVTVAIAIALAMATRWIEDQDRQFAPIAVA